MARRLLLLALLCLPGCDDGADPLDGGLDATADDMIPPDVSDPADSAADLAPDGADLGPDRPDMTPPDPDSGPDGGIALDLGPDAAPDAAPDALPDADPDAARDAFVLPDLGPPREQCFGGIDDDGDGLVDCADPDCRRSAACFEAREDCGNGVDDDGDLRADCEDRFCLADPRCPPPDVAPYTTAELQARFDQVCADCHGPVDPFSSLDLSAPFEDAVVDVLSVQVPMPLVKPGDRAQSFLYLKITFRHLETGGDGEGMPPAFEGYPPWSAEEAERLGRWIEGLGTN